MKPIILTEGIIGEMIEEFKKQLVELKTVPDGKFSYTKEFKCENERPKVAFSQIAYAKMTSLVREFDSEVAWHGTVRREDNTYYVDDIFVYPQVVTSATVETDPEEYGNWLYNFDDDTFVSLRFQGHSHVNFSPSPSAVDLEHQKKIVSQLSGIGFYIFFILNKKNEYELKIFDLGTNTLYEKGDIDVEVSFDNGEFMAEAKKLVANRVTPVVCPYKSTKYDSSFWDEYYNYPHYENYGNTPYGDQYNSSSKQKKHKVKW